MGKRRGFSGNAAPSGVRWLLMAVPQPCTFENILGGIHITVGYIATERTNMGSYRQTLLYDLATVVALLRGEARIDSYHPMTSSCSLFFKDVEECAPTSVHDALCQGMILDHVENTQFLNSDDMIAFSVVFSRLIVKVTTLTGDLEMRLCSTFCGFASAVRTFLAAAYLALLAPQGSGARAIEARVLKSTAFAVSEKGLETNIHTNSRMLTCGGSVLGMWLHLTDNERIPVSISTVYQVNRLGSSLYRTMEFDLEEMSQLLRHDQMLLILMQKAVLTVLPQLDRVPAVRLLETWEANTRNIILLGGEEARKRLREPVCKHLYGGGGNMCTSLTFESMFQIVLTGECLLVLILLFDHLKHTIIDMSRLSQASHEQAGLFLLHVQSVLKCFHVLYYSS